MPPVVFAGWIGPKDRFDFVVIVKFDTVTKVSSPEFSDEPLGRRQPTKQFFIVAVSVIVDILPREV
jgi:hypothetical protein